ncbi:hypothetical protein [Micromonospora sp. RP3T]|uniref:hypothetical protein n=1 Tax=Micromonospora sp. RP3T TaxID=2135446 RepID=UPI003D736524
MLADEPMVSPIRVAAASLFIFRFISKLFSTEREAPGDRDQIGTRPTMWNDPCHGRHRPLKIRTGIPAVITHGLAMAFVRRGGIGFDHQTPWW